MLTPAGSGNLSNENEYTSHKHILNKSFNRWQSLTLSFSFVFSEEISFAWSFLLLFFFLFLLALVPFISVKSYVSTR